MLLKIQIETLKPDFIIFLSGISAAKTRKEFFEGIEKGLPNQIYKSTKYLWEFMLDKRIHCIRTHHPSARSREAQKALIKSQKLLRNLIEQRI
jgi:hypothetical protein